MSAEYWNTLKQNLNGFWKPVQEIICLRIFKKTDSECELCGYKPITWNHVLINLQTTKAMNVGSRCVNNHKVIIDRYDSNGKVILFNKYHKSVYDNNMENGCGYLNNSDERVMKLDKLLSANKDLNYKTLDAILKFASGLKSDIGDSLFDKGIDIFAEKKYYLVESSGLAETEYNDPKKWEEYCFQESLRDWGEHLSREAEHEVDVYSRDYDPDDEEGYIITDDDTPEGLGLDDIDWDSNDIEGR